MNSANVSIRQSGTTTQIQSRAVTAQTLVFMAGSVNDLMHHCVKKTHFTQKVQIYLVCQTATVWTGFMVIPTMVVPIDVTFLTVQHVPIQNAETGMGFMRASV